ncbi:T-lymphocyte activation antigen CD80 [Equus asinus]|uniref:T-lymphocyte activation antigen CD80 n=1 Tax=Equus asinus TaxID=9793 RepID=A0A8C4M0M2_EQUAS|nr:T-lymphocyte activation antigen CD80 [Equus asinus]XP_046515704.1 T-lymphocyte activation antigen CD80 [Equus quagga]
MGHTLKWGAPPPKRPYLRILQLLLLAGLFCFSLGIIQVTKTVREIAILSCEYNISTDELTSVRIYWQKDREMVLAVMSGKVQVWPKYENRTFTDITNNLSIVILALRLSDNGTYTCVIQKSERGSFRLEHLTSVMLLVRANFPVPTIAEVGNPSLNIKRINCSTSGGFPEPHLSWLENGTEVNAINTTVFQDPETELYTISSELDFNMTNNHSFVCLVKYGDLTVSQTFKWQIQPKLDDSPTNQSPLLTIIITVSLIGTFVIAAVIWQRLQACRPAPRRRERSNEGNMEMEWLSSNSRGSAKASG